jgi:hypothetical protein
LLFAFLREVSNPAEVLVDMTAQARQI